MVDSSIDAVDLLFRLVPYHEAGHAVTAWYLGLVVESISAKPKRGSLGRCYLFARRDADHPDKNLLVALAGEAAANKILPGKGYLGLRRDRRIACRCALVITKRNKAAARQLIGEKRVEIQTIVDRNWIAITDVASELSNRQQLTGRQATKIIIQPWLLSNLNYDRRASNVSLTAVGHLLNGSQMRNTVTI